MFLDFYRLREEPFGVTPDPRYLYLGPTHREALASLFYGIETGRGFLALVAEPGMGKTTLLFQLLERLKDSVRSAFLFQTQCDSRELLRYLLDALGLDSRDQDLVRMHGQLNEFLFREVLAGRRVVLVIDEAQNLSDSVLETVRLLSDFEAPDKKLLQIVLSGQPELASRLLQPGLGQLRQRIAVRGRLDPLPSAEVVRYVNHRLEVAGYDGPELFTPAALALIAQRSQGIPRSINNICFSALSLGCARGCKRIGPEIVEEAAVDLSFDSVLQQSQAAPPVTPARAVAPRVSHSVTKDDRHSLLQRSQAAPPVAPACPAAPNFSYSTTRDDRRTGWLPRIAVLAAIIGSSMIYFEERGRGGMAQFSSAISESAAVTRENESAAGVRESPRGEFQSDEDFQAAELRASGVERQVRLRTHRGGDSFTSFRHVVQPNDTLQRLCLLSAGRYDDSVVAEIRKLNPGLIDLNHIEVGQQILLPLPRHPLN